MAEKDFKGTDNSNQLSNIIKETHKSLRQALKDGQGDALKVWKEHKSNESRLRKYATSMRTLAVEHWLSKPNESRIHWVHKQILNFFHSDKMNEKIEKERRKVQILSPDDITKFDNVRASLREYTKEAKLNVLDVGSCYNPFKIFKEFNVTAIDLCPADQDVFTCDFLEVNISNETFNRNESKTFRKSETEGKNETKLLTKRKISGETPQDNNYILENSPNIDGKKRKVLDSKVLENDSNFSSKNGVKCDIDHLREIVPNTIKKGLQKSSAQPTVVAEGTNIDSNIIKNSLDFSEQPTEGETVNNRAITKLPGNHFDAIIFCLLLEYIPCPKLRRIACSKAFNLLTPNGLLCIITPDSKHETANSRIMKLWKISLTYHGFERIKYEKCTHFHGMLFRKTIFPNVWRMDAIRELDVLKNKEESSKNEKDIKLPRVFENKKEISKNKKSMKMSGLVENKEKSNTDEKEKDARAVNLQIGEIDNKNEKGMTVEQSIDLKYENTKKNLNKLHGKLNKNNEQRKKKYSSIDLNSVFDSIYIVQDFS